MFKTFYCAMQKSSRLFFQTTNFAYNRPKYYFSMVQNTNEPDIFDKIEPIYKSSLLCKLTYKKLRLYNNEFEEINKIFLQDDLSEFDDKKLKEFKNKIDKLSIYSVLYKNIEYVLQEFETLLAMLDDAKNTEDEEEVKNMAELEKEELEEKIGEMILKAQKQQIKPDKYDDANSCVLEFRPGTGGGESELFAYEMLHTFSSYCGGNGWRFQITAQNLERNFLKFGQAKVSGQGCYKRLVCESGVHKVIRVPETENKGRLHSSTMSIAVLPEVPFDFTLDEKELKITYTTSQGPGGQSVNKTDSACRISHIPTGLQVLNQETRDQQTNKKRALEIIKQRIFELHFEKHKEEERGRRSTQMGSGDRSEKIRTYNFPQDRMTDHRTNFTIYGINKLDEGGALDEFIDAYLELEYEEKVKLLLEDLQQESNQST